MSDQIVDYWEWQEEQAFELESLYHGEQLGDVARLLVRSNAYAKVNSQKLTTLLCKQELIADNLRELRRTQKTVLILMGLIVVCLISGFELQWFGKE